MIEIAEFSNNGGSLCFAGKVFNASLKTWNIGYGET